MRRVGLIAWLSLAFATATGGETLATEFREPTKQVAAPRTAEAMRAVFDEHGYDLGPVRAAGVAPRIYVHSVPLDLAKVADVHEKKSLFIRMLLPLVLKANEEILAQRARLQALHGGSELADEDRAWLAQLAARYGVSPDDTAELLVRVNAIPPSLALAQGIDESGWGTSHFARADEGLDDRRPDRLSPATRSTASHASRRSGASPPDSVHARRSRDGLGRHTNQMMISRQA